LTLLAASCVLQASWSGESRVVWYDHAGEERWSASLEDPEPGTPGTALTVPPWRKGLPDIDVRVYGGSVVPLAQMRGSVVVLEFWATWCEPCQRALPKLQALYETRAKDGLKVIAINVGETPQVVLPYVEEMGLTMPIGIFQESMIPTLFGKAVPTMVVADREGKIRGRWDEYNPDQSAQATGLIEHLLEAPEEPRDQIATVVRGESLFRPEWMRRLPAEIDDVHVAIGPGGEPSILVSHGRLMAYHFPDGRTEKQWGGDRASGRLRLAPVDDGSRLLGAGFRPGRQAFALVSGPGGSSERIDIESHVFDLVWWPDPAGQGGHRFVIGTLEGLLIVGPEGEVTSRLEGFEAVSALARIGEGPDLRLVVLETSGKLSFLDPSLTRLRAAEVSPESWTLVAGRNGLAVGSGQVVAGALGRFLGAGDEQLAVATRDGGLFVLSAASGDVLFEAAWEGITRLGAGDLDNDGVDELIVGQGNSLGILRGFSD
jgi:thiol-disulfide isomerase/thioredoxin